ncbi:MAG: GNAT family N-acetyltransferase [Calditrichaeota bacterium]|nr:MAG: GNAT family N-acetyltransferase [Calditrichota bacterium]
MTKPADIKADIVPYSDEYAAQIRGWIESAETYKHVCRGTDFPPPENIISSWQRDTVNSYILIDSGKPIAYGELWHRKDEMAFELAHILVDPYKRSQGYGTKLIKLLYERAATRDDVAKVIIKLFQENPEALSCLMKAGFEITGTTNYTTGIRLVKYA